MYAVLVDVGADWPEVVFVGGWDDAQAVARRVEDSNVTCVLTALITADEAIREAHGEDVE